MAFASGNQLNRLSACADMIFRMSTRGTDSISTIAPPSTGNTHHNQAEPR
jgi:hypothetical protein